MGQKNVVFNQGFSWRILCQSASPIQPWTAAPGHNANGLPEKRQHEDAEGRTRFVPNSGIVASDHVEAVIAGGESRVTRASLRSRFDPLLVVPIEPVLIWTHAAAW
jgi:hypothetical protein